MQELSEVANCGLCGTPVRSQDLEAGTAIRHAGKTLGACCLPALQRGKDARPAAAPDSRSLTVGLVLLAAIVAATLYLESRMNDRIDAAAAANQKVVDQLDRSVASQDDLLRGIDSAIAAAARQTDLERLEAAVAALQAAQQQDRERARSDVGQQLDATRDLAARLEQQDLRERFTQALADVTKCLQVQSEQLAELLPPPPPAPEPAESPRPSDGSKPTMDQVFDPKTLTPVAWPDAVTEEQRKQVTELLDDVEGGGMTGNAAKMELVRLGWSAFAGIINRLRDIDYKSSEETMFAFELNKLLEQITVSLNTGFKIVEIGEPVPPEVADYNARTARAWQGLMARFPTPESLAEFRKAKMAEKK